MNLGFGQTPQVLTASRGLFSTGSPGAGFFNTASSGPPVQTGQVKFHPGMYMYSANTNGSPSNANGRGGNGRNLSEHQLLVKYGPGILGWIGLYDWTQIEYGINDYAFNEKFGADFVQLQANANGMRCGFMVKTSVFNVSITPSNYTHNWTYNSPGYILNGSSAYGSYGPNGTQRGYCAISNIGTTSNYNYTVTWASRHNTAVNNRYLAMFQALSQAIVPDTTINGQLYSGYTYDTHPYIELIGDWDERSIQFTNPFFPSDYVTATDNANWVAFYQGMATAFPHTLTTGYNSFGCYNDSQRIPTISALIAAGNQSKTFAYSNSDVLVQWPVYGTPASGIEGQQLFAGNSYSSPTNQVGNLVAQGGTDLRGTMPSVATVQEMDYGNVNMSLAVQKANITPIYNNAINNIVGTGGAINKGLNASHILWAFGNINYVSGWWQNYVYPTICPGGVPWATVTSVPTNLSGRAFSG